MRENERFEIEQNEKGISDSDVMRAIVRGKMGYKVVEYVQSNTGAAGGGGAANNKSIRINTGIDAKTGLHVKTKMRWNELSDCTFCGGRYRSQDSTRFYAVHTYQNKWLVGYGSKTAYTVACETGKDYEVESKLYLGSQTMFVDGEKVAEMTENTTVTTLGPVAVLAAYYPANEPYPMSCASHTRCYYLKLWENGNTTDNPDGDLARDFVPAMKGDRCGLYDLKNREFVPGSANYLTCNNKTNELSCTIRDTLNHDPGAMPVRPGLSLIVR